MSITRLTGGLTPADGDDPRTYPTIFNDAADEIDANTSAISALSPRVTTLENTSTVLNFWSVTNTGFFTWIDGPAGGGVDITGLTIADVAVSDAANHLLIFAFVGVSASSSDGQSVGLSVSDGSNLLSIGDAAGSRGRTTSGGPSQGTPVSAGAVSYPQHITIKHTPGDLTARTYRMRLINLSEFSRTLYVNRTRTDTNTPFGPRGASAMHIMEIAG